VKKATNEEIENPPLVLAALKLRDESITGGSKLVDEVDYCPEVEVSEMAKPKLKRQTTFHALLGKVDVNAQNRAGITALHIACSKGNINMVKELLVVENLEINKKDIHKNTPLHAACVHGSQSIVKALIDAGADYTEVNERGRHPLHVAVVERNLGAVNTILQHAAINGKAPYLLFAKDNRGYSVFLLAVLSGDEQFVKFLLHEEIATIKDKCRLGFNCFHYAASRNRENILQLIHGYDESFSSLLCNDAKTISHDTPLHVAAETNQVDALTFLVT